MAILKADNPLLQAEFDRIARLPTAEQVRELTGWTPEQRDVFREEDCLQFTSIYLPVEKPCYMTPLLPYPEIK